jgi:hypothetical protein
MSPDPPQSRRAPLTLRRACMSTTLVKRLAPARVPAITGSWSFLLSPSKLTRSLDAGAFALLTSH